VIDFNRKNRIRVTDYVSEDVLLVLDTLAPTPCSSSYPNAGNDHPSIPPSAYLMRENSKLLLITSDLTRLRVIVGFLGQKKNLGWWDCDFLDPIGLRFLETTFPRTAHKAALRSTTEAASRIHDQAMGRIGSYHLFRFPVALEDGFESAVDALNWTAMFPIIQSRETAMAELKRLADSTVKAPQGPVQVGVESRILTTTSVQELAAHYHSAFQDNIRCFPYFSARENGR